MKNFKRLYFVWIAIISVIMSACMLDGGDEQKNNTQSPVEEHEDIKGVTLEKEESDFASDNEVDDKEEEDSLHIDILNDDSLTVLVNKYNSLDEGYEPDDLVSVTVPTILENPEVNQLRKVAADALQEMFAEAEREEIYLFARSGYRSYETQVQLFQGYANKHGEEAANRYSAKPGFSEHQTGLVMDITSESVHFQLDEQFGETVEGKWVADHAHQFGFIIRYPKGKENITGYIYEPWHLRYVGKDIATELVERQITYEEFLIEEGIIDDITSEK